MPPSRTPLLEYLKLQKALDREVLASLRVAAASTDKELQRLLGSRGIGGSVRATQLAMSKAAINRNLEAHWIRVGNITAAHQAAAAAAAAEGVLLSSTTLASIFTAEDLDYMTRSVRASAEQNLKNAMERISGSSHIPLSDSVYSNRNLSSGKIDKIINSALARGASAAELARDVKAYINPNTPGGVRYASLRLGRTELNNAFHASQIRQAQIEPWTTAIKWELSGSHTTPDDCNSYAEDVHFTGGEAGQFLTSEVPLKPHPNCLCYTVPESIGREEFIRQFEAGEYDEYLDEIMSE